MSQHNKFLLLLHTTKFPIFKVCYVNNAKNWNTILNTKSLTKWQPLKTSPFQASSFCRTARPRIVKLKLIYWATANLLFCLSAYLSSGLSDVFWVVSLAEEKARLSQSSGSMFLSAKLGQRATADDPPWTENAKPNPAKLLWLFWNEGSPFRLSGRHSNGSAGAPPPSLHFTSASASLLSNTFSDNSSSFTIFSNVSADVNSESQTVFADSQLLRKRSSCTVFMVSELPTKPVLPWRST